MQNPDSSARKLDIFDASAEDEKMRKDFKGKDFIKSTILQSDGVFNTKVNF